MAAGCLYWLGFQQGESASPAMISKESLSSDCDSRRVVGIILEREECGGADFGDSCNVVDGQDNGNVLPCQFDEEGGANANTCQVIVAVKYVMKSLCG